MDNTQKIPYDQQSKTILTAFYYLAGCGRTALPGGLTKRLGDSADIMHSNTSLTRLLSFCKQNQSHILSKHDDN